MTHYKNGVWTAYHKSKGGLASESIWSLAELPNGQIAIGTLGARFQFLNPVTGEFRTYNQSNCDIESDYVSCVTMSKSGKLLLGHSQGFSVFDLTTGNLENHKRTKSGKLFLSLQVNQIFEDTRGLAWIATNSGLNILDKRNDDLYELNSDNGLVGTIACAVTEDHHGNIWVSTDKGVGQISVSRHDIRNL